MYLVVLRRTRDQYIQAKPLRMKQSTASHKKIVIIGCLPLVARPASRNHHLFVITTASLFKKQSLKTAKTFLFCVHFLAGLSYVCKCDVYKV